MRNPTRSDDSSIEDCRMWRRLDFPGQDAAWLHRFEKNRCIHGTAIWREDQRPCHLHYRIVNHIDWQTHFAFVSGQHGRQVIYCQIEHVGPRWLMNGVHFRAVDECPHLDLAFSPATNTLSVRFLELEIGQSREIIAAWLTWPELQLKPLRQIYTRKSEFTYGYEAPGLNFSTEITVAESGLVREYPPLWTEEK